MNRVLEKILAGQLFQKMFKNPFLIADEILSKIVRQNFWLRSLEKLSEFCKFISCRSNCDNVSYNFAGYYFYLSRCRKTMCKIFKTKII